MLLLLLLYFNFLKIILNDCSFFLRKAPEFQCHIKYKNDLPLPPVTSVLFDSTLTLSQKSLTNVLRNESVAYSPTSLEKGTKHFSLPMELMKFSVYNMVDIENMGHFVGGDKREIIINQDDKEILFSIEELERKFNIVTKKDSNATSSSTGTITSPSNTLKSSSTPIKKFSRPDVTWLRRTEYISSVKNNPNNASSNSNDSDEAKALLSETIKFEEIYKEVEKTFDQTVSEHPIKSSSVELAQSYPIILDENSSFIHCLLFGEQNSVISEGSILKLDPLIATLFDPTADNASKLKSVGEFDCQKTESTGKSFVLMLPSVGNQKDAKGHLAKITSTLSLRKKRNIRKVLAKNAKIIKLTRK
jgi:hypothetical protein